MPRYAYSYKLKREIYLLAENEWSKIQALAIDHTQRLKEYRQLNGASISEAVENVGRSKALEAYEQLTGERLENADDILAVRMKTYGSICPNCHKPFRTPQAKTCAECGFRLPSGTTAGPLLASP